MDKQSSSGDASAPRRPLKTRQAAWPRVLAGWLIRAGLTPNRISICSILFALVSAAAFLQVGRGAAQETAGWLLLAGAGIQLRLLCNLLDGLMAIEGGQKSKTGNLYNDVPDRISDSLTLIAAGYAIGNFDWAPPVGGNWAGPTLGWAAALLAVLTAYIRLLGGACGATQYFIGPLAKQQRMGLLTAGCLLAAALLLMGQPRQVAAVTLTASMCVIVLGSALTCVRRLRRIAQDLNAG